MWNANAIAGLTKLGARTYDYNTELISLSGLGRASDPAVSASFSYDDTVFGVVDSMFKTLASCAVNTGAAAPSVGSVPYSGQYVQLQLFPVQRVGYRNYEFSGFVSRLINLPSSGQITALHASMSGPLDLADIDASGSANRLVTMASELPYTATNYGPTVLLCRPSALTWPGQDASNEANRTIWKVDEVAEVSFGFTVLAAAVDLSIELVAQGWLYVV